MVFGPAVKLLFEIDRWYQINGQMEVFIKNRYCKNNQERYKLTHVVHEEYQQLQYHIYLYRRRNTNVQ